MWTSRSLLTAMAAAALVAACGGDGDDGAVNPQPPPPTYVKISATNQDTVARTSFGSVIPFVALPVIGGNASPVLAKTAQAGATSAVGRHGGLTHLVMRALDFGGRQAAAGMARPLVQFPPEIVSCSVSGSQTYILDDKDNSKTVTAGDTASVTFNKCDEGDGTVNGSMVLTISAYSETPTVLDVTASATFQSLTIDNDPFSFSADGDAAVRAIWTIKTDGLEMFASFTVASGGMKVVKKAIVAGGLSDTFSYRAGFTVSDRDFMSSAQGVPSSEIIIASGDFGSQSLGGDLTLSTIKPFKSDFTDPFGDILPTEGQLLASGAEGTKLQLTATQTMQVLMEVSYDSDADWEYSQLVTWDWLFS